MARDHARIQTAIWRNRDFRALTRDAQHMYFTITSQEELTYCGLLNWWPNRLANLSSDGDEAVVYAAVKELMDSRFVILDPATSELLVRTYVRHDHIMIRKNMGKAMGRALALVVSLELRDVLMVELARLYHAEKQMAGWEGFKELYVEEYKEVISIASNKAAMR